MRTLAWKNLCIVVILCSFLFIATGTAEKDHTVVPTKAPPEVTTSPVGYVEISSVPPGAEVDLWERPDHTNATQHNITPATFKVVPSSYIRYSIRKPGYYPEGGLFMTFPESWDVLHINKTLYAIRGVLEVTSNPSGADVVFNGISMGHTPISFEVKDTHGCNILLVEKPGYPNFSMVLAPLPVPGAALPVHADLLSPHSSSPPAITPSVVPAVKDNTTSPDTALSPTTTGPSASPVPTTLPVSGASPAADMAPVPPTHANLPVVLALLSLVVLLFASAGRK